MTLASLPATHGRRCGHAPDLWHFYSKNPALAQREFSEVVEKSSSPAKFRMTSHNFMNPVNKPDAFESEGAGQDSQQSPDRILRGVARGLPLRAHALRKGVVPCVPCERRECARRREAPVRHRARFRVQGRRSGRHHQREAADTLVLAGRSERRRSGADRVAGRRISWLLCCSSSSPSCGRSGA